MANSTFQTFRDRTDNKDHITMSDVYFSALMDLKNARNNGDIEKLQATIATMDMLLVSKQDKDYEKDLLEYRAIERELKETGELTQIEEMQLLDLQSKMIIKLLDRVNRGEVQKSEGVDQSEIVKELAHKLMTGTGQNVALTGQQGSGKSWGAIKIAYEVARITGGKFSVDNIVFNPTQFLKLYNDQKALPEGSVVIFDDAGVTYNSKDSQSQANKVFSKVVQIIRHRCLLIILTTPDLSYIDMTFRKSLHWWLETVKLNKHTKTCHIKPHVVEVIQMTGEILYPFPRFGIHDVVRELTVSEPPATITNAYKDRVKAFKDEVGNNAELMLSEGANIAEETFLLYKKMRDEGKLVKDVKESFGISSPTASKLEKRYKMYKLANKIQASNSIAEPEKLADTHSQTDQI